jgi:hypothetical protein
MNDMVKIIENMEKKTFVEWIIYLKNKKNIDTYINSNFHYWSSVQKNRKMEFYMLNI